MDPWTDPQIGPRDEPLPGSEADRPGRLGSAWPPRSAWPPPCCPSGCMARVLLCREVTRDGPDGRDGPKPLTLKGTQDTMKTSLAATRLLGLAVAAGGLLMSRPARAEPTSIACPGTMRGTIGRPPAPTGWSSATDPYLDALKLAGTGVDGASLTCKYGFTPMSKPGVGLIVVGALSMPVPEGKQCVVNATGFTCQ